MLVGIRVYVGVGVGVGVAVGVGVGVKCYSTVVVSNGEPSRVRTCDPLIKESATTGERLFQF
jgi:hypothetical protein